MRVDDGLGSVLDAPGGMRDEPGEPGAGLSLAPSPARMLAVLLTAGVGIILSLAVLGLPRESGGLTGQVAVELDGSGVTQPVTAVLLTFRGYDTWLEVGVLLVAVVALLALRRASDLSAVALLPPADPVLAWLTRLLLPLMVVIGGYLLWLGTHAPGGAFQAGAVLGAAAVLLRLAGYGSVAAVAGWPLRVILVAGCGMFLLVGGGTVVAGRHFLQYPVPWAGSLIILIEVIVTITIAAILAALFIGTPPEQRPSSDDRVAR